MLWLPQQRALKFDAFFPPDWLKAAFFMKQNFDLQSANSVNLIRYPSFINEKITLNIYVAMKNQRQNL